MDFSQRNWMRNKRLGLYFTSDQVKIKSKLGIAAVCAIAFGIILGAILIYATGFNGFGFIGSIFHNSLDTLDDGFGSSPFYQTLMYFSVYVLMGLGISLGFKIGIFNMGGSGQAVLGMAFAVHLIFSEGGKGVSADDFSQSYAVVIILVFVLSGVLISTIAGVLKAFLNVHEVVTSIMLNWIVWFFFRWYDTDINGVPGSTPDVGNAGFSDWFNLGTPFVFGLIVAALAVVLTWVVLTFTTVGYKFKVVGKQSTAAKYAGINAQIYIILTTAVQGLLIGLGAVIYYFQIEKTVNKSINTVPSIGFDALTIPLVAFNNIWGILPVAFLWAMIKCGMQGALLEYNGVSRETGSLVFGLIIYGSAVYVLFTKIKPWKWITMWIAGMLDWHAKNKINIEAQKMREMRIRRAFYSTDEEIVRLKGEIAVLKEKLEKAKATPAYPQIQLELQEKKNLLRFELKNIKKSYSNIIKQCRRDIYSARLEGMKNMFQRNPFTIWSNLHMKNKISLYETLDKITRIKNEYSILVTNKTEEINNKFAKPIDFSKVQDIVEIGRETDKEAIKAIVIKNKERTKKINDMIKERNSILKSHKKEIDEELKIFIEPLKVEYTKKINDVIQGYNDSKKSRTELYAKNKPLVKEELISLKTNYKSEIVSKKLKFKSEVKATGDSVSSDKKALYQEVKNNELNEKQIQELLEKHIAIIKRDELDVSSTEAFKLITKKQSEEMGVINKYGRF